MLRILSDLHFRDASSRLQKLADLEPLLDGVEELWLNGDTCDNQTGMTPAEVDEIRDFFLQRVPKVVFLTGNHDPDISTDHEASTADGRIWATHGDAFLDNIVPWSRVRRDLVARMDQVRAAHPSLGFTSFEDRIWIMRMACTGFAREVDPEQTDFLHRLLRLTTEFFPPQQPWAMLRTWMTFADRVAATIPQWRPHAKVVVTGHVHFPRVWRRGPLTVVNTGAFTGPLGSYSVDYDREACVVRRLDQRDNRWHPGKTITTIQLASPSPSTVSSSA